jgi:hypothetical protein
MAHQLSILSPRFFDGKQRRLRMTDGKQGRLRMTDGKQRRLRMTGFDLRARVQILGGRECFTETIIPTPSSASAPTAIHTTGAPSR